MRYLTNALSLNMLTGSQGTVSYELVTRDTAVRWADTDHTSAVGHADTAAVIADHLGRSVPANRVTLALAPGDELLVAQYRGPRLPEGVTSLPAGASIDYYVCRIS